MREKKMHITKEMDRKYTTAVEDIERKQPTNMPSDNFAPHNCRSWQVVKLHISSDQLNISKEAGKKYMNLFLT